MLTPAPRSTGRSCRSTVAFIFYPLRNVQSTCTALACRRLGVRAARRGWGWCWPRKRCGSLDDLVRAPQNRQNAAPIHRGVSPYGVTIGSRDPLRITLPTLGDTIDKEARSDPSV